MLLRTGILKLRHMYRAKSERLTKKRESLNIRIGHELNDLIERAARLVGSNRTGFILGAARRAAQDVLLDRSTVLMRSGAFRKFVARVNATPRPNKRLIRSMRTPAPWE